MYKIGIIILYCVLSKILVHCFVVFCDVLYATCIILKVIDLQQTPKVASPSLNTLNIP